MRPDGGQDPPARRRSALVPGMVATVGLIAAVWLFRPSGSQQATPSPSTTVETTQPTSLTTLPFLEVEVPLALIFDDGLDRAIVIDPNDSALHPVPVEGQRPGDQPYRLERVEDHLIVGWDEIYAVDLSSGVSSPVGDATIYVPASEPDRVWLIDYPSGRIGPETPTAWQASVARDTLRPRMTLPLAEPPAIGVPGGLAVETDSGISIIESSDLVVELVDTGPSFVSDVSAVGEPVLAWCDDKCEAFHISEIASGEDTTFGDLTRGDRFEARAARFSPNGRYVAAPTAAGDIVIYDREQGRTSIAFGIPVVPMVVEWSADGSWLVGSGRDEGDDLTMIGVHELGTGVTLIFGLTERLGRAFVVVGEDTAEHFLANSVVAPSS